MKKKNQAYNQSKYDLKPVELLLVHANVWAALFPCCLVWQIFRHLNPFNIFGISSIIRPILLQFTLVLLIAWTTSRESPSNTIKEKPLSLQNSTVCSAARTSPTTGSAIKNSTWQDAACKLPLESLISQPYTTKILTIGRVSTVTGTVDTRPI
jgi:hypothetical protein